MSFKKIQIINPWDIDCPESGHIYFGRNEIGLWEKYSNCQWVYITTGSTTGDGTSGTSGEAGTSGVDGGFYGSSGADGTDGTAGTSGKSGSSGRSGIDGISGSSGKSGTGGTSGTSGKTGSSGKGGSAGTSGSAGITGSSGTSSNGSSGSSGDTGSSGTSGGDGAYGAATRVWRFTDISTPSTGEFYANGENYLGLVSTLLINVEDSDGQDVSQWLETWDSGLLKIEKWGDASIFGIYDGCISNSVVGRYQISAMNEINSNGSLVSGERYLLSFIKTSSSVPVSFTPNSGVEYISIGSTEAHTIYNTLIDPSLTTPVTVGGILAGTTAGSLSGKTLVGIIDDLLFPTVLPTYTIPTIVLISTITGIREVGSLISPLLTLDGTQNDASVYTSMTIVRDATILLDTTVTTVTSASPIPSQFGYADPNNPNFKHTIAIVDGSYEIPSTLVTTPSYTVYGGSGNYNAGLAKNDNKGIMDSRSFAVRTVNAPQLGSISPFQASTITISGYYPYFYGKSSISVTPAQVVTIIESGIGFTKVVSSGAGSLSMTFNLVGEWGWFAVFAPFTTKTAWVDNTNPLNNGSIGSSITDLFSAPTSLSVDSDLGYWYGISFKIYVAQKVTTLGSCSIS